MRARDWGLDERVRGSARVGISRVSSSWFAILQAAVAAGLSWALARLIVGQPQPFFAPAAAVIALGVSRGQPRRRAVELSIGVAVGIGIAALIVRLIGVGAIQVTVLVALVMSVALLFGNSPILINQAAVSALLIMTLPGEAGDRFLDACVGGAVAVLLGQFLLFRDPLAKVAEARRLTLADLAAALEEIAAVLATPDLAAAEAALARARRLDQQVDHLYDAVGEAGETVSFSPRRRTLLERLDPQSDAAPQLDYAVRDTRVLARATVTATRREVALDPRLARAVEALAEAARALGPSRPGGDEEVARLATAAAREASRADTGGALWATMVVGQSRAIAFDLLRAAGEEGDAARTRLGPPEPTLEAELPGGSRSG